MRSESLCLAIAIEGLVGCTGVEVLGRDPYADWDGDTSASDASASSDGCSDGCDAGSTASVLAPDVCFSNLSFEGTPQRTVSPSLQDVAGAAFDAPPWQACSDTLGGSLPSIADPSTTDLGGVDPLPAAYDGATYLALRPGEGASQPLCTQTFTRPPPFALQFEAYRVPSGDSSLDAQPIALHVTGSTRVLSLGCYEAGSFGSASILGSAWKPYCVEIYPTDTLYTITFQLSPRDASQAGALVLVDAARLVAACP
jgi:hypothetical protein